MRDTRTIALASIFLVTSILAVTGRAEDLIVVTDDATYKASQPWLDFLALYEVPVKHVPPKEFEAYKKEQFVVLLGGLNEPEGIRELAKEVLAKDEFEYVSKDGNGEMYFKFKVWDPMQTVILFVGSDLASVEAARKKNKEHWWNTFITWFSLDAEMEDSFHVY